MSVVRTVIGNEVKADLIDVLDEVDAKRCWVGVPQFSIPCVTEVVCASRGENAIVGGYIGIAHSRSDGGECETGID